MGRGETWFELEGQHAFLKEKVDDGLKLTKIRTLLRQHGVEVPYRTLEPGQELQADFGRLGKVALVEGPRAETLVAALYGGAPPHHQLA